MREFDIFNKIILFLLGLGTFHIFSQVVLRLSNIDCLSSFFDLSQNLFRAGFVGFLDHY